MSEPSFEDELRATMRAHDREAPTADPTILRTTISGPDGRHGRRPGRARWLSVAAVVFLVAAVGAAALAVRSGQRPPVRAAHGAASPAGRIACPTAFHAGSNGSDPYWVPAEPSTQGGSDRLAPAATPQQVVVCGYLGTVTRGHQQLTEQRDLGGDLRAVTDTLAWQPGLLPHQGFPCAADLEATDGENFLVGLTYESGRLWVSMPGQHCDLAGNGRFVAANNLAAYANAALRSGRWTANPGPLDDRSRRAAPTPPCTASGRLHQERTLVPSSPTSAVICTGDGKQRTQHRVGGTDARQLAAALNALPTVPSEHDFTPIGDPATALRQHYTIEFTYERGPGVEINVYPDARPPIDNGSLQATKLGNVVQLINQLS